MEQVEISTDLKEGLSEKTLGHKKIAEAILEEIFEKYKATPIPTLEEQLSGRFKAFFLSSDC